MTLRWRRRPPRCFPRAITAGPAQGMATDARLANVRLPPNIVSRETLTGADEVGGHAAIGEEHGEATDASEMAGPGDCRQR